MLALGANGRGRAGLLSALRPQDVFATSLYTGTGATQTITNGIQSDFAWLKSRSVAAGHRLIDAGRGSFALESRSTAAEIGTGTGFQGFTQTGFVIGSANPSYNTAGNTYTAWSIKRASKFFDIVTYTGDGTSGRVIPHALGIKPGMIIIKRRDALTSWLVYHASIGAGAALVLNETSAQAGSSFLANTEPTATAFSLGSGAGSNASSGTYVAYLFAHDPDPNGIVQCGSFTAVTSTTVNVDLGYNVQFVLSKASNANAGWAIRDTARGLDSSGGPVLQANATAAEAASTFLKAIPNGFSFTGTDNSSYIYLAIRAPI